MKDYAYSPFVLMECQHKNINDMGKEQMKGIIRNKIDRLSPVRSITSVMTLDTYPYNTDYILYDTSCE